MTDTDSTVGNLSILAQLRNSMSVKPKYCRFLEVSASNYLNLKLLLNKVY